MSSDNETKKRKYTTEYLTSTGALLGFAAGMLFEQVLAGMVAGMGIGGFAGYLMERRSKQS